MPRKAGKGPNLQEILVPLGIVLVKTTGGEGIKISARSTLFPQRTHSSAERTYGSAFDDSSPICCDSDFLKRTRSLWNNDVLWLTARKSCIAFCLFLIKNIYFLVSKSCTNTQPFTSFIVVNIILEGRVARKQSLHIRVKQDMTHLST